MKDHEKDTSCEREQEMGGKLSERGFSYPLDEFDKGGGFCLLELRSFEPPFLLCFIHFFFTCFPSSSVLMSNAGKGAIDRKM